MRGKLGRVHKYRGGRHIGLFESKLDQAQMAVMQRAHGRREGDAFAERTLRAMPFPGLRTRAGNNKTGTLRHASPLNRSEQKSAASGVFWRALLSPFRRWINRIGDAGF